MPFSTSRTFSSTPKKKTKILSNFPCPPRRHRELLIAETDLSLRTRKKKRLPLTGQILPSTSSRLVVIYKRNESHAAGVAAALAGVVGEVFPSRNLFLRSAPRSLLKLQRAVPTNQLCFPANRLRNTDNRQSRICRRKHWRLRAPHPHPMFHWSAHRVSRSQLQLLSLRPISLPKSQDGMVDLRFPASPSPSIDHAMKIQRLRVKARLTREGLRSKYGARLREDELNVIASLPLQVHRSLPFL